MEIKYNYDSIILGPESDIEIVYLENALDLKDEKSEAVIKRINKFNTNNMHSIKLCKKEKGSFITDDFLYTLVEAAQTCGNGVDWVELRDFVVWCFHNAGKECPSLVPYDEKQKESNL
jgi:hypothetical protein